MCFFCGQSGQISFADSSNLFELVVDHLQQAAPAPEKQTVYAKTLLGVDDAMAIEAWVEHNREHLLAITTNKDWLNAVWDLLSTHIDDKFFGQIEPQGLPIELARGWLDGVSYGDLVNLAAEKEGTRQID